MTTIPVFSRVYYLTQVDGIQWRNDDHCANKIIKAIKGEKISGFFNLTLKGRQLTFRPNNQDEVIPIVLRSLAKKLDAQFPRGCTLVPIPNSPALVGSSSSFRTLELAEQLAELAKTRVKVVGALRWRNKRPQAHKGGGYRDWRPQFENLKVVKPVTGPVVLFDDVITSGSQIKAAYRRLEEQGIDVQAAMVVGRVTREQMPKMMVWSEHDLDVDEG